MRRHIRKLLTGGLALLLAATARAEDWPQFRGPRRDNVSRETGLLRSWPESGPRVRWTTDVCQGYAGAAIHSGRIYFNDYNEQAHEWYVRCLDLSNGRELWRYADKKRIRPNHGITRTVPAVDARYVFTLDPKCVFHCLDAATGKELWRRNLVRDYHAKIPPWYNGQCPLIDSDRVVLGVGGDALLVALDKATGNEAWRTPNSESWPLSHSSVMPAELGGVKQYLWCTLFGPLGVRASDGKLLWHHARKFNVAVSPSPLAVGPDRVFMTGPYDAGSVMVRVAREGARFNTATVFDWDETGFSAEVHTPILFQNHLFAIGKKKRGLLTCLDPDGEIVWDSRGQATFGLGSFLLADGMFFVLEGKTGMLRLVEANTTAYRELAHAQVLSGHDVWAPMALSGGQLVLRDMSKMVCLDVAAEKAGGPPGEEAGRSERHPRTPFAESGGPTFALTAFAGDEPQPPTSKPAVSAPARYRKLRVIECGGTTDHQFTEALRGLTFDKQDRLYVVGDSRLVVFDQTGKPLRHWQTARPGYSVAVGPDGTVYVGQEGQVQRFDADGTPRDTWRDADRLGLVTSIGLTPDAVLIADAAGRCIRQYDPAGRYMADLVPNRKMRRFMLPNRHLDLAVESAGVFRAINPGQHRIYRFDRTGGVLGHFGRFDGRDPAGFTGCCNPTNLALTPSGDIVVTEKAPPRVKAYNPRGQLLTVVATDDFDPHCWNMDVAVDARGRIHVIDTQRLAIVVYEPSPPSVQEKQP